MRLAVLLVGALLLAGCSTTAVKTVSTPTTFSTAEAPAGFSSSGPMFQFVGVWEGTLKGHSGPNLVAGAGAKRSFRIAVNAQQVHVFQQIDGQWSEMKPGTFSIYNWGSQAIIYSLTSGQDKDGTWVEGSSFTLVHHSPSSIIAYWLRTVNNLNLPVDNPDFHFAWEFSGEMRKVSK
jgi:hypothetical protein